MYITSCQIQKTNLNQPQKAQSKERVDFKGAADKLGPDPRSLVREAQEVGCLPAIIWKPSG